MDSQDVSESGSVVHIGNLPVNLHYPLFFVFSVIRLVELFLSFFVTNSTYNWIATYISCPFSCLVSAKKFLTRRFT